jgi:hypothetical protein
MRIQQLAEPTHLVFLNAPLNTTLLKSPPLVNRLAAIGGGPMHFGGSTFELSAHPTTVYPALESSQAPITEQEI